MKEIALASGKGVALVDDEDYELVANRAWYYHAGYARSSVHQDGRIVGTLMHRLVMGLPPEGVDHRDGDRLNNQKANLRPASRSLNAFNMRSARSDNHAGVLGVGVRSGGKWQARITKDGRTYSLGYFSEIRDAVAAREFGELALFGEVTAATQAWLAVNAA